MRKRDKDELRVAVDDIRRWKLAAQSVVTGRALVRDAAKAGAADLRGRVSTLSVDDHEISYVLLDGRADRRLAGDIERAKMLEVLSPDDEVALTLASGRIDDRLAGHEDALSGMRLFHSSARKEKARTAAAWALATHARGTSEGVEARLMGLKDRIPQSPEMPLHALLEHIRGAVGSEDCVLAPTLEVKEVQDVLAQVRTLSKPSEDLDRQIVALGKAIRTRDAKRLLSDMPVEALKKSTSGRVRFASLAGRGITSVQDVLDHGYDLDRIEGISEQSGRQIWSAAELMRTMVHRETPVRIDVKAKDRPTSNLLRELRRWALLRRARAEAQALLDRAATFEMLLKGSTGKSHIAADGAALALLQGELRALAAAGADVIRATEPPPKIWQDFLSRPADYLGWLAEFGFQTEDQATSHGLLSDHLIQRVRGQELDTSLLRDVSLRGYQDFAARFALVQGRVIIGDEMGLGKTVEALAVLAHAHARGATHSVVVCPASVVTNWIREIEGRSSLEAHRVHGVGRARTAERWARRGGIAVTTYETLRSIEPVVAGADITCTVVDEAHYIKNPGARRTQRTRQIIDGSAYAVLLTGTPMENKVEEFSRLVSYLQPDVAESAQGVMSPIAFQRAVAPAYLRRNQEDVLTELPELIEVEEKVPLSTADRRRYEMAVLDGNFMAMRRAAMLTGQASSKMMRLQEVVDEAGDNHRKCIVFSYFRDVLDEVAERLGDVVIGPLTGSVSAAARQAMVDQFAAADAPAVLVSQITAGGVGLNIQAASVVVICEPQVKPSMEAQAIARAHRMGQTQTVQVHRLLGEDCVDDRMVEILADKQRLFDEFARKSATADSVPEATDISEAQLARLVIAAERERLARRAAETPRDSTPIDDEESA